MNPTSEDLELKEIFTDLGFDWEELYISENSDNLKDIYNRKDGYLRLYLYPKKVIIKPNEEVQDVTQVTYTVYIPLPVVKNN